MKKFDEKHIILILFVILILVLTFGKTRADDFGVGSANVSGYVYEWGGTYNITDIRPPKQI